jgi:hypothetical protein
MVGDSEPLVVETAWPHLVIVYNLLHSFFHACPHDPHFNVTFERSIFGLFQSPDSKEREQIVLFFFTYLSKYPERESNIWRQMADTLVQYRQGCADPFAVPPILLFFSRRFVDPPPELDSLRWQIYRDVVVPLASSPHVLSFQARIEAIVRVVAVEKPIEIANFVKYLTKVFPFRRDAKQLPFIAWLERMAESVPRPNFWLIARPLFVVYATLAASELSNVVGASFRIWDNATLMPMIIENAKIIYPIMLHALAQSLRVSLKEGNENQASSVLRIMQECNRSLFEDLVLAENKRSTPTESTDEDPSELGEYRWPWATIARAAARNDETLQLSDILVDIARYYKTPDRSEV